MERQLIQGDCRLTLPTLPAESVNCIVTSPPYYGLRDYGVDGQIGLEPTPEAYVAEMVAVFHECRRVLRGDGVLWLNLGDSYNSALPAAGGRSGYGDGRANRKLRRTSGGCDGLKPKDLIGIPWRVAFALQADGWYLRQDIIWAKPNPMPESVTDRCTKAHEYLFLLTKSERYWFDAGAIAEAAQESTNERDAYKRTGNPKENRDGFVNHLDPSSGEYRDCNGKRNKRSVWTINTQPCSMAHFAVMPEALVKPCILAGCPVGGTVLDPFGGSGTVGKVAEELGRNSILCELNPEYIELQKIRTAQTSMAI